MNNQIQGDITGNAVFAPRHSVLISVILSLKQSLHAVTLVALREAGIGIYRISIALRPKVRKAN